MGCSTALRKKKSRVPGAKIEKARFLSNSPFRASAYAHLLSRLVPNQNSCPPGGTGSSVGRAWVSVKNICYTRPAPPGARTGKQKYQNSHAQGTAHASVRKNKKIQNSYGKFFFLRGGEARGGTIGRLEKKDFFFSGGGGGGVVYEHGMDGVMGKGIVFWKSKGGGGGWVFFDVRKSRGGGGLMGSWVF